LDVKRIFDFKGRVIVELEKMVLPNGKEMEVFRVNFKPHTVSVLPLKADGTLWLLEQYRPAVKEWVLEAPAGTGVAGEDPRETALRELEEETGLRDPEVLEKVAEGYVSPGYTTEFMHYFLAWNPKEGRAHPEEHEVIRVKKVSIGEALDMIKEGKIRDAKTILLILYAALKLGKSLG